MPASPSIRRVLRFWKNISSEMIAGNIQYRPCRENMNRRDASKDMNVSMSAVIGMMYTIILAS